jgi:hypothetical protein
LRFFALRMTTEPKIPGTFIPRRVFTQPGSSSDIRKWPNYVRIAPLKADIAARCIDVSFVPCHGAPIFDGDGEVAAVLDVTALDYQLDSF